MKYFALLMSLIYGLVGCLFLFTAFMQWQIPRYRVPLGLVLLGYGLLRGWMWYRKDMQSRQES